MNRNLSAIFFRVDGSPKIGLGHLMRCIALAHMLKNDFNITFVCKEISEKIKNELVESDFSLLEIDESVFFNLIKPKDIVVLDGYHFDTAYQKKIKTKGVKLVCIDDLHNKEFVADLIINHAPGVKSGDYKAQPYTQFALGVEFALLRPIFLEQAKKVRKIVKTETVFICFGGSDYKNFTESTLKIVLQFDEFKKIIVVTGSAYQYSDSINQIVEKDKRVIHYHAVDEKEMLALMLKTNLAIVPSSGILYEVLSVGCKVISGYYIDNQIGIYEGFLGLKAIIDAKNFETKNLINSLSKRKNNTSVHVLDGNSSFRVLEKIKKLKDVYSDIS